MTEPNSYQLGFLFRYMPGLAALRSYKRTWLGADLSAGIALAAVALPIGIAHAEIVGVPTEIGVYSAIFPLFAFALFGHSRRVVVGPDSATSLLVAAAVAPLGQGDPHRMITLMLLLSLLTGILLVIAGLFRLGFVANFLSHPILIGFMSGTGLVLLVRQIGPLLGYSGGEGGVIARSVALIENAPSIHPTTAVLGTLSVAGLLAFKRYVKRLPPSLAVIVLGLCAVALFGLQRQGVGVIGEVSPGLPSPNLWLPGLAEFKEVLADSTSIAIVAAMSGLLTITSFARAERASVDANADLMGLGAANILSGLAQGFPVTAGTARTAVLVSSGARSQLASLAAGALMLVALLFLTVPLALVPEAALAAIILLSAWSMVDVKGFRDLFRTSRVEFAFATIALLGVLLLGVLPGVGLAVGLSLLWLIYLESNPPDAILGRRPNLPGFYDIAKYPDAEAPQGTLIYQFSGSVVFFNADRFRTRLLELLKASEDKVVCVIIDAGPINNIDVSSVRLLTELHTELSEMGVRLAIANHRRHLLRHFEEEWVVGALNGLKPFLFPTLNAAVRNRQESS